MLVCDTLLRNAAQHCGRSSGPYVLPFDLGDEDLEIDQDHTEKVIRINSIHPS